jgi:hypothetical protein
MKQSALLLSKAMLGSHAIPNVVGVETCGPGAFDTTWRADVGQFRRERASF